MKRKQYPRGPDGQLDFSPKPPPEPVKKTLIPRPNLRKHKTERGGRVIQRRPRRDAALNGFFSMMDRDAFQEACEASQDVRFQDMARFMDAPRFSSYTLATISRECRITLQDLFDFWRNHQQTLGMMRMMTHVPDVLDDVGADARSITFTCETCGGVGTVLKRTVKPELRGLDVNQNDDSNFVIAETQCRTCHGKKTVREPGSLDARKLMFEAIGLTGRRSSTNVIGQLNIGDGESLEAMVSTAQRLLTPERPPERSPVVDVTPEPVPLAPEGDPT